MVLDPEFLSRAKASAERITDLERDLATAKAEQAHAIRRLHLGGGSLREIAKAVGLSYQRVHQLVGETGGMTTNRRRKVSGKLLTCSFCSMNQKDVQKLIAGPSVYICDGCIGVASDVLNSGNPIGEIVSTPLSTPLPCSFCGKGRAQVSGMAQTGDSRICDECLDLCHEILKEESPG